MCCPHRQWGMPAVPIRSAPTGSVDKQLENSRSKRVLSEILLLGLPRQSINRLPVRGRQAQGARWPTRASMPFLHGALGVHARTGGHNRDIGTPATPTSAAASRPMGVTMRAKAKVTTYPKATKANRSVRTLAAPSSSLTARPFTVWSRSWPASRPGRHCATQSLPATLKLPHTRHGQRDRQQRRCRVHARRDPGKQVGT